MSPPSPPATGLGFGFAGRDLAIGCVLVVVTLALYAPVRQHQFLNYDDGEYVTDNPAVRQGLTAASVRWALTNKHQATWHPLTSLSHLLDVELFGLDAGRHLTVNVVLHACATLLLFLVLHTMTGARWPSAWVAGVFAWHPLHVESVAWVSERKDVLSGVFWMLALASYAAYARRPSRRRLLGLVVVVALGLLAKPMLVTLPFVLLLLDHWPLGRWAADAAAAPHRSASRRAATLVAEKLPLFALAAAISIVTVITQSRAGAIETLESAPWSFRVGNALVAYVTYLRKAVWPVDLAVFYPAPTVLSAWLAIGAAVFLLAVSGWAFRHRRRHPYVLVGWLWYLGTLVPVLGLIRQGEQAMADRYTYLPSIGVGIMLAWGLPALLSDRRWRPLLATGAAMTLGACLLATSHQLPHWATTTSLFRHALAVTRDNYVAHQNLGAALMGRGETAEAMTHYQRALAIAPRYADGHLNLGLALARSGAIDAALASYAEAARLKPHSALIEYNWGSLLAERGQLAEAIAHYERALQNDPTHAKAANNLGWALAAQGRRAEAVARYQQALAVAPDLTAAHNNLAVALEGLGRHDDALTHYAAAVRLAPTEPRARANYAAVLAGRGRTNEAIAEYRAAVHLAPDFVEIRADLASALVAHGRTAEAIEEYREVLRRRPAWPVAEQGLARLLAPAGDPAPRDASAGLALIEGAATANGGTDPDALATLAAAYAGAGRFDDATATAERALGLAHAARRADLTATLTERLAGYRDALRARDQPPPSPAGE